MSIDRSAIVAYRSNKKLLAEAFSNLLDLSPDSSGYWKALQSKCCESFPKSLTNDEQQPNALSFASLSDLGRTLLLQRAQELAGVALAASSFAKPLSAADVTDVLILSKHMYIIEYNEATALSRTAAQLQGSTKASQYLHSVCAPLASRVIRTLHSSIRPSHCSRAKSLSAVSSSGREIVKPSSIMEWR